MDGKIALEEHWAVDETLDIAGQPIAAGPFWERDWSSSHENRVISHECEFYF